MTRDGLTLGVSPPSAEDRLRTAWDQPAFTNGIERTFLESEDEISVIVRRGSYTGLMVAMRGTPPGILFDRLDLMITGVAARQRTPDRRSS